VLHSRSVCFEVEESLLSLPEIEPRIVYIPETTKYTDWAIPAARQVGILMFC